MKRFVDDTEELVRMLDLNNMINEYIGRRKQPPPEEPKPRVNIAKPLLVFDLNLNAHNLPRPPVQRSTETAKGRSLLPVSSNRLRSHTTLSTNDEHGNGQRTTSLMQHQVSIDKPLLEKVVRRYQRVQSAKIAVNKITPKSEPLDTGLSKPHFSSLDARCRKTLTTKTMLKNRYELISVIGRGHYSLVHRARDTLTTKDVAIKVINDTETKEPALFKYLHHPNIVGIINTFVQEDKTYMVMEYHPLTLSNYLKNYDLRKQ